LEFHGFLLGYIESPRRVNEVFAASVVIVNLKFQIASLSSHSVRSGIDEKFMAVTCLHVPPERIVEFVNESLSSGVPIQPPRSSLFTSPQPKGELLMSTPWVPPYFGSWEELVRSVLHNPFLGSGTHHPLLAYLQQRPPHIGPPDPGPLDVASFLNPGVIAALNPQPLPPRWMTAIFVAQLSVKDLTSRLPKEQGGELTSSLEQTIADEIDFVCGNVPHIHGPIPGPSPFAFAIAAELNLMGNTMQEGTLRNAVLELAGQIVNKATAPAEKKRGSRAAA
jgi:hypothetical protein